MIAKFVLIAASAVVFGGAAASADLLVNGNFENMPNFGAGISGDAGYSALTGNQIPGWTIEASHAATVHNTVLYPTISGGYSINMDGEGHFGNNANLYQDFASTLGNGYLLEFDWQGWQGNSVPRLNVSITDTVTNTVLVFGNYGYDAALHHEMLNFVGTGNTLRLRVEELPQSGFNDNTFMVDNFSVTPTPGAAAVLGLGMLTAGRRRR
ncbi:MAG: DUF642 domain-containing protein [Phycisphaerales bacterium]